ncbi:Kinetochore protein mis13 [Penicillium subrubescens]|uniref:Kinetochore protein mis13 n=1 Tax=Penicillium subrubescens TaxID=1316194 RepID=A0A1Q5ULM9_9EURO|nr:Kinetochore protein mis13 [Penicillium subrubescens]
MITGYDEDADGFQFSLLPSKKPKPSVAVAPHLAHSDVENTTPKPSPRRGRPPKKRAEEHAVPAKGKTADLPTRRPTRGSTRAVDAEAESHAESAARSSRNQESHEEQPSERKKKRGRPAKAKTNESNGYHSPEQPPPGIKVALPTADTPVIQRNKEFRGAKSSKGGRRSSLQMRGRRASDLIDSGTSNALPHREVSAADFYKHIADEGLPEPRRMRQLLIWCATRALPDKPSGSHSEEISARLAARAIQEEILKEFSSNSDLSNWFSREDVNPPTVVVKKPNPRNVQNTDKIKELEEQIQKLQKERHALNALLKQPAIPRIDVESPKKSPKKSPRSKRQSEKPSINTSLLDPSQQAIYATLNPTSSSSTASQLHPQDAASSTQPPMPPSTVSARLSRITTALAPTLDTLAAGVHDIELYRSTADAVSSQILRICAQRLEERDARNTQQRLAIEGEDSEQRTPRVSRSRPREDLGLILGALSRVERR